MDLEIIALTYLLNTQDVEFYNKLDTKYFTSYSDVFKDVKKFYNDYKDLPTFEDFEIHKDIDVRHRVLALKDIECPDIENPEYLLSSILDKYAEKLISEKLSKFIDDIPILHYNEMIDRIAHIGYELNTKFPTTDNLTEGDLLIYDELYDKESIDLGINTELDSILGGLEMGELAMFGGKRGQGKSILLANVAVQQFLQNNSSLYFSVEMSKRETFLRYLSILSGVPNTKITKFKMNEQELIKLAETRALFFNKPESIFEDFMLHGDYVKYEQELVENCSLKNYKAVIIDSPVISISDIDLHLHNYKKIMGNNLRTCVVDYISVLKSEQTDDMYDWKAIMYNTRLLKELARKHDISIITACQLDNKGNVRMSKGIEDAVDLSFVLETEIENDNKLPFLGINCTKSRSRTDNINIKTKMNWSTLKIGPDSYIEESKVEEPKQANNEYVRDI